MVYMIVWVLGLYKKSEENDGFPPTTLGYSVNEPDGAFSVKFNEFVLMSPVSA